MFWDTQQGHMVASIVYALIGVGIFAFAYIVMEKVLPFSLKKELAEDDNVAVGVVVGSIFIGISIIIASAIGA
jgi:putative membrane protein